MSRPDAPSVRAVSLEPDPAFSGADPVDSASARLLPERVCRHFRILPIAFDGETLTLAMADPGDAMAGDVAVALTGERVEVVAAPADQLARAIERVFGGGERLGPAAPPPSAPRRSRPFAAAPARTAGRLGRVLLSRGAVDEATLTEALERQGRTGARLEDVLRYEAGVDGAELASALAEAMRLPLIELEGVTPSPEALALIPEPLQRQGRCLPLEVDQEAVYLATADPLDEETYEAIRELTDLRIRAYVADRAQLERTLRELHREENVRAAREELLARFPESSASRVLSKGQRWSFGLIAAALVAGLVLDPLVAGIVVVVAAVAVYVLASVYKLRLLYESFGRTREIEIGSGEPAALDERTCPRYSVLVPLFREAAVVPRLVESLAALDYPRSKLEILLLCEEGDEETLAALREAELPLHFRLLEVPDSHPKTKPKACNYGLLHAGGRYVVIYDAEDRPAPDQLKKALLAFDRAPEGTVCVQCKLNYYNAEQNLLTRFFAIEYALWFELMLPGLGATGAPLPLGGTSNHLDREALVELGAWDPFNVTEDADLGLRLRRAGGRTAMLGSSTLEEASSRPREWLRQRSRWVKGYLQTYLVHMRHPLRLMRELGFGGWWSFQLIVGGTVILLLNPVFWALTTLWALTEAGVIESLFPGPVFHLAAALLLLGNFVFAYLAVAGAIQRGLFHLVRYALFSPLYWGLMSVGAWIGLAQLLTRPFHWEKTEHGFDAAPVGAAE